MCMLPFKKSKLVQFLIALQKLFSLVNSNAKMQSYSNLAFVCIMLFPAYDMFCLQHKNGFVFCLTVFTEIIVFNQEK